GGDYYELNLSYTHKFDNKGHELVAYANYQRQKGNDGDLQLEYPANSNFIISDLDTSRSIFGTRSNEPGDENEFRAQVDYTKPIGEDGRFQAGYQARIDDEYEAFNFFRYYPENPVDERWLADSLYSTGNDFYRNIQAVYATYGNKLGNYQFQLGLRGEYTDRSIKDKRALKPATINRFDIFPTLHLARNFDNGHQVMVSFSRRINRPRGWYLEPFVTYIDAHTVRQGDPNLKPEYLNSYELGYQKTFGKSFVSLEAYYRSTQDKIDRIIQVYDANKDILLHTYGNVASDKSLGAELMIDYSELKWLELNLSGSVYRYSEKGNLEGVNISKESNNWDSRLNATFNFSTKTRLQLQAFYNGPSVTIQGTREGFFFTNLALRHDFLDRKLAATLQVRDLFGTANFEQTSYGNGFNTYMKFSREPRIVMLSLSYKLNNFRQKRQGNMENGGEDMSGEGEVY
ncbi:MAG TPA: outer membrane beta-barrel family protein, partial [Bacteroidales bacterium]|nr:outer membrane beta-barrel family protein [Bacteroidales bacterium]